MFLFRQPVRIFKWVSLMLFLMYVTFLALYSRKNFFATFPNPLRLWNSTTIISFFNVSSYRAVNTTVTKNIKEFKSILIWNSPRLIETAVFGFGHEPFHLNGCEVTECTIFDSDALLPLEHYDAIIVHVSLIWLTDLPSFQRKNHQRFIFLTAESPASIARSLPDISRMGSSFNWTMSYRLNSDIQFLYGRIAPNSTAPKTKEEIENLIMATHLPTAKNYARGKTHLVAWMVSHCNTLGLREVYVRQLSEFISVDIYGKCGNLSCPRNTTHSYSDPKCYDLLEAKYKFYLSFENSICDEYVTEKFFEIMKHDIIPVVYGGANYSNIAPYHSYIDALTFTPKALAQYLNLLDTNDTLYNEYFWWKDHYRVQAGVEQMARNGFCDLCKKLHQTQNITSYYEEMANEWNPRYKCKSFENAEIEKKKNFL